MAEKSTDAEIELRIATVYEMVIKGASRKYIMRYCAENWNLASRQVDTYLKRVDIQIKKTYNDKYRESLIQKQMAQLDDLYVKNYTIEDFRECRSIIESRSKMLGLNAADKIDQNIKIDANINLSKEKIKQISDTLDDEV